MFNMLHTLTASAINNLRFDLAKQHVNDMFTLAEQQPQFSDFFFFSHYNAGLLAKNQGDFDQAIGHYKKALNMQDTTSENYFIREAYENLAVTYFRTNELDLAKETLTQYKIKYPNAKIISQTIFALKAKLNGDELASYEALFSVIDEQIKQRREFTYFAVQATANIQSEKISALDVRVLEQDLNISQLKLANTLQEKDFIYYGLLFTVLFTLTLLAFIGYLLKIHLKFKHYARTDGLTGIANRRFILELGQRMLKKADIPTKPLTILLFDIDNFKQINDQQGHHVGDQAIKLIVENANNCLRKQDKIGRIGGDEFLLLLPDTTKGEAQLIAERIRGLVEKSTKEHFAQLKLKNIVSVSIGVISAQKNDQLQAMIIRADNALYRAKDLGRNVVVLGQ
jgi:diguanylate cyclase (GGDEF)-like protein